jgi:hypothetical protein
MGWAWRLIAAGSGGGKARRLLRIWAWYERFDLRLHPNMSIPDAPCGVFQITLVPYRGKAFTLPDGTEVKRGDLVCRLHICNPVLMQVSNKGTWRLQPAMTRDLRALAAALERGDLPREVRAVFGVSMLARVSVRLGFVMRRRPRTFKAFLDRLYFQGLLALYCPQGAERLTSGRTVSTWPEELWMSRAELLRRYGEPSLASSVRRTDVEVREHTGDHTQGDTQRVPGVVHRVVPGTIGPPGGEGGT